MVIVSKQLTVPSTGKQLSDYAEGDMVKIKENGSPVEFYVAKHNYESGLNGSGRTLVVRKDCYDERSWHSSNVNAWANCSIRSWLNSTYLNLLDADIRALIGTTKYYYTPGNGNWSVATRSDAVFLLSATELGQSHSDTNTEGSTLPIANTLKITYQNGSAITQWTRSPDTDGTRFVWKMSPDWGAAPYYCTNTGWSRPVFTLPSTAKFDPDTNVIIG